MTRRLVAVLASAILLATLAATPATARETVVAAGHHRFERIDVAKIDPQIKPFALDPSRQTTVMLELARQPVASLQAAAEEQGQVLGAGERDAAREVLKAQQDGLSGTIRKAGGRILGQYQDAYDGIKVRIALKDVTQLATLPGVVAIHAMPVYTRANTTSVPYTGASEAWTNGTGFTGKGVKIAIIDSGIDYYHADFGGSGNPDDWANDDGVTINPKAFPSAKVAGGWDFAGDAYDASATGDAAVPKPDPNPLDCDGHGTHVAGTAAGYGVLADGSTFHGPYDANIYKNHSFLVGPGAAPEATLYALRIFGCLGSSDLDLDAIDWAVKHDMDVINMSFGSPFGAGDAPDEVAVNNAARAGIVVVTSAGNEGPVAYTAGGPGTAQRAIATAAIDAERGFPSATIKIGSGIEAINANNSKGLPVTGPIRVLTDESGGIALGCDSSEYAAVQPGDVVVTQRGVCARVDRATLGQEAGAAAVIMVNNSPDDALPPFEDAIPDVTIPFLGVGADAGDALQGADGTTVTIVSAGLIENPAYRALADFTSAGPRSGDSAMKPDVTAPGVSVKSAAVGTGTQGIRFSGTSMASPVTTGIAALIREAHPKWTPEQVKAAIMNTADATPRKIAGYDARLAGAGIVQAQRAIDTVALATTGPGTASLSFGYHALQGAYRETLPIRIQNTGRAAITYKLAAAFAGMALGASVRVSPAQVTVQGGGTRVVKVTLSLSQAAVKQLPSVETPADDTAMLTFIRGAVTATPTKAGKGLYPLRVPFLLVPRTLSDVQAGPRADFTQDGTLLTSSVDLHNTGLQEGSADVYAWGLSDPKESLGSFDIRAVGVQSFASQGEGDIIPPGDNFVVFAINTWGRWSNAAVNEFDITVDTDNDGTIDYVIAVLDYGYFTSGENDGQMAAFVIRASDGVVVDGYYIDAPMNGSTLLAGVLGSDIGLTGDTTRFTYSASAISSEVPGIDQVYSRAAFDVATPAISQGDYLTVEPGATETLPLAIDLTQFPSATALGWMVVSQDDPNGAAQAELVPAAPLPPFAIPYP